MSRCEGREVCLETFTKNWKQRVHSIVRVGCTYLRLIRFPGEPERLPSITSMAKILLSLVADLPQSSNTKGGIERGRGKLQQKLEHFVKKGRLVPPPSPQPHLAEIKSVLVCCIRNAPWNGVSDMHTNILGCTAGPTIARNRLTDSRGCAARPTKARNRLTDRRGCAARPTKARNRLTDRRGCAARPTKARNRLTAWVVQLDLPQSETS